MPFPEKVRHWWMRVAGDGSREDAQCQYRYFTDEGALRQCQKPAEQVHHPIPESLCLQEGIDPNNIPGVPLCKPHHVGANYGLIFEGDGSFHPDIGQAYYAYRAGDHEAFGKAVREHHKKAKTGERFWNGDEASDNYYWQLMEDMATKYTQEHPDDRRPRARPHKNIQPKKKWYDGLF